MTVNEHGPETNSVVPDSHEEETGEDSESGEGVLEQVRGDMRSRFGMAEGGACRDGSGEKRVPTDRQSLAGEEDTE